MEKQLFSLCEAAKKASVAAAMDNISENGPEVSRCIDCLKRLKDFPVTGELLVSTAIDKHLRHLRQHKKGKIRLMAKWLMEIWSKKIKEYSSRTKGKFLYIDSSKKTQQSVQSTKSTICHQYSSIGSTKLEERIRLVKRLGKSNLGNRKIRRH
ncbi:transcription elongation factor TFIIS-like [Mangifera indica]|uniref:transcription elongation factor TFIIS-like n=1 Tax=Mangifera indica TaxID=29780 RepID=UPI001CFADCF8|nr:transcription elongation factor TFIIS-like [Mangifera indica]